jgi:hypothetical protein
MVSQKMGLLEFFFQSARIQALANVRELLL